MTRSNAVLVERARGEEVRRALAARDLLRSDLEIRGEGERLAFPVRDAAALRPEWGEPAELEFAPRARGGPAEFRELLDWPERERSLLPRSFDVVGDVVLVRLPVELEERRFEVGEALRRFVPGARIVGLDRGVRGPERLRAVERIAGDGGWRTRHRENGLDLEVDLERAYFSPRLAREHALVAAEVGDGERVYDLCCGVGPFALTIARAGRARRVVAVDANPEAIALLRATAARYPFRDRITAVEGRVEEFVASAEPVERVVLNLPREGIKYAVLVAPLVVSGGRLVYYEVVPRDEVEGRGSVVEHALSAAGRWAVRSVRLVHPYSPSRDLVAVRADRRAE